MTEKERMSVITMLDIMKNTIQFSNNYEKITKEEVMLDKLIKKIYNK